MTKYSIKAPDGKNYSVEGNGTKEEALAAFKKQWAAKNGGGGGAPQPTEGHDDTSLAQKLFDVRSARTGESYIYGNKPAPSQIDDLMRIGADTASRGLVDKVNNTANLTANARERTPDYVEAPLDIATGIVTSPYKILSTPAGAGFGALEGAASAYGHQKDWIPTGKDLEDIGWEAGKGALYGGVGAEGGKWLGKFGNAFKEQPKIGNEADLMDAAERAAKRKARGNNISPRSEDIIARNARMDAAKMANAESGGFEKMVAGMDDATKAKWPRNERELLARLANPDSLLGRMTTGAGTMLRRRSPFGLPAMLGTGLEAAGGAVNAAKKGTADFNQLMESILDTTGRFAKNRANVDFGRDTLSKTLLAADKSPVGDKKKKR